MPPCVDGFPLFYLSLLGLFYCFTHRGCSCISKEETEADVEMVHHQKRKRSASSVNRRSKQRYVCKENDHRTRIQRTRPKRKSQHTQLRAGRMSHNDTKRPTAHPRFLFYIVFLFFLLPSRRWRRLPFLRLRVHKAIGVR